MARARVYRHDLRCPHCGSTLRQPGHPATVPGQMGLIWSPIVVGLMRPDIHLALVSSSGSVADNASGIGTERRSKGRPHTACAGVSVVVGDAGRIL